MIPPGLPAALMRLSGADRLLVATDFDGVLAPLVDDPATSTPVAGVVATLARLARRPRLHVALVSGRSVADLRLLSGLTHPVVFVGSHGAEWSDGEVDGMTGERRDRLAELTATLQRIAAAYEGVRVEIKPASAALHVRTAPRDRVADVLAAVAAGPASWPDVHVSRGKDVVEIMVVATGKGVALDRLRERLGADAVFFAGDDVTDEDAFRRLQPADVGVKVGPGETAARWRVEDPTDVAALLQYLG